MPEMIGAEFLARSQEIAPHSIRIMLTGYSDIEAATQAINEGGIYRYITKPWDDEDIKMVVREALERLDLEQQNRQLTEELKIKNALIEKIAKDNRVRFLKTKELICSDQKETCEFLTDSNGKIIFDSSHFTVEGAKYLGNKIEELKWF